MPKSTPITVPSLAEACPDYAGLAEKRAELAALHGKLTREKADLWRNRDKAPSTTNLAPGVARLVGDEVVEAPSPRARFFAVKAELAEVDAALAEIDKRLRAARGPASRKACEMVRKPFTAAAVNLAEAMLAVHAAHLEMTDIIEGFAQEDVDWQGALPNISAAMTLGHPRDKSGRLAYWLRSAAEAGVIKASDIPEAVR